MLSGSGIDDAGITIVISPLISLMMDQVKALNEAGIHAAYINSSLTENQVAKALEFAKADDTKSSMWRRSVWRLQGFSTLPVMPKSLW